MPAFQTRLTERLRRPASRQSGVDPQRLAQEAAMLADRSDIGEEIARLQIHSGQLEATARRPAARSARSSTSCCRR